MVRFAKVACAFGCAVVAGTCVSSALAQSGGTVLLANDADVAPRTTQTPSPDPLELRIAYLHERLRITPAQEKLWANLAQTMRDNARVIPPLLRERFRTAQTGSVPDYLHAFEKLGEAQLDGLKKFVAAFQALYDTMSEQQKKIADVILRLSPVAVVGSVFQLPGTLTSPPRQTAGYIEPPVVAQPGYAPFSFHPSPRQPLEIPPLAVPPYGVTTPYPLRVQFPLPGRSPPVLPGPAAGR